MPIYYFQCPTCDETDEDICMFKNKQYPTCSRCGTVMSDDFKSKVDAPADVPRVSSAMGVHPSQIDSAELEKVHPGAKFNPNGDMLLKNRSEQKQRLKERNWVNRDSY